MNFLQKLSYNSIVTLSLFFIPLFSMANMQQSILSLSKSLQNLANILPHEKQSKSQPSSSKEIVHLKKIESENVFQAKDWALVKIEGKNIIDTLHDTDANEIGVIIDEITDVKNQLINLKTQTDDAKQELNKQEDPTTYFKNTTKPIFDNLLEEYKKNNKNILLAIQKLSKIKTEDATAEYEFTKPELNRDEPQKINLKNFIIDIYWINMFEMESFYYFFYYYDFDSYESYSNHILQLLSEKLTVIKELFFDDKKKLFEQIEQNLLKEINYYAINYVYHSQKEIVSLLRELEKTCNEYNYTIAYTKAGSLDPYAILGISKNADEQTIKKTYKKLILLWHPDKYQEINEKEIARKKTMAIMNAYKEIKNIKNKDEWLFSTIKNQWNDNNYATIIPLRQSLQEIK